MASLSWWCRAGADFTLFERLIDEYLAEPPCELSASDLAVRAQAVDQKPEGAHFDYAGLADALRE